MGRSSFGIRKPLRSRWENFAPPVSARATKHNLGDQRELVNPSAETQQDCVSILPALGCDTPQGGDTYQGLRASPISKCLEILKTDRITSVAKARAEEQLW